MEQIIQVVTALGPLAEKYGMWIIGLVLILFFFFKIISIWTELLRRMMDKAYPDPNKQIPGQKKTVEQIKALNEFEIKVNGEVNKLIETIRTRYNADRVAIMQYHNGTTFLSWSHNVKVSMTHEAIAPGIWYLIREMQDIPSALFTHANSNLLKWENYTIIYNTETEEWNSDSWVVATYRSIGYKSVYAIAIRKGWHLVGKIVVWFLDVHRLSEQDIEDITNTTSIIESIITL